MRKFRILALMLVLIMVLAGCGTGNSTPAAKDIVILYTNDAHCGIEDGMGYQGLSAAKRALLAAGNKVLLVDNGDAVQGDTIGTLSKGEYIIDIMNKLGYDVATPGNHEFDYGMDQFNKLVEKADFDYISCNFVDKDGNPVLKPYVIKEADGVKIAFVGISTPKTITTSTPTYFQDGNGNYIYGFMQDDTGEKLYTAVQSAVDAARKEGAKYVIAMAHLGIEADCQPWTSSDVIVNTSGIDVVLDLTDFDRKCRGASLVITGEGHLDSQSLRGKTVVGVARRARALGVPAAALVGGCETALDAVYAEGVSGVFPIHPALCTWPQAAARTEEDLRFTMGNLLRFMAALRR